MTEDPRRVLDLISLGRVQHNWEKHYKLKEGDIFVEGGSFWGRYIWKASKNVGPKGRVIAVEPSPENIKILKVLIKAENLENVTLVEKALWNGPRRDLLFVQGNSASHQLKSLPSAQTGGPLPEYSNYVEVELDTIDNILTDLGIKYVDLLSADIEGSELEMLKGCEKYLSEKRIRNIAVAVYHIRVDLQDSFMELLREKGYKDISREDEGIVYAHR